MNRNPKQQKKINLKKKKKRNYSAPQRMIYRSHYNPSVREKAIN